MVSTLMRSLLLLAFVVVVTSCNRETPVMMWVDGFQPENVRFEVQDLGPQTKEQLQDVAKRPDIDGSLLLPQGECPTTCKAAVVTVFVTNRSGEKEPPPVVRLASPPGKQRRLPIAFRDMDIEPGRIGRIRWLVELYPEEKDLTATLSSSVRIEAKEPQKEEEKKQTPAAAADAPPELPTDAPPIE